MVSRLFISSAGINTGGGLVLFESLLKALDLENVFVLLDERLKQSHENLFVKGNVKIVRRSFIHRIYCLFFFGVQAEKNDTLFCFNSLPPVRKSKAKTITFVHSPQFVGLHKSSKYPLLVRTRFFIENVWLRLFRKNTDVFWVQTNSMRDALISKYPDISVQIVPFVDGHLYDLLASFEPSRRADNENHWSFFIQLCWQVTRIIAN